jgi:Transglycosylase-like domain
MTKRQRRFTLLLPLLSVLVLSLIGIQDAGAHLTAKAKTKHDTLSARKVRQEKNLAHARYVCNNGANKHKRWACRAAMKPGWLVDELKETLAAMTPVLPARSGYAPLCGSSCVRCESGFNPQARSRDGLYWGWYQFDYGTWVAHGGAPGEYGRAGSGYQTYVASRVTYDAWPNC